MSETAPEIRDADPAVEPAEAHTPPAQLTSDEMLDSVDAELDRRQRVERLRDGVEDEPAEEPKRDYSPVVDAALEMNIPLKIATPDRFADVDLQDTDAIRSRLRDLHESNDQAALLRQAIEQAPDLEYEQELRTETAQADARAILDAGDPAASWQAASIIREQHPEILQAFLAEWTRDDPGAAQTWAAQNPPIDWDESAADDEWQSEEWEREAEEQMVEEGQRAIDASLAERVAELRGDPKTARLVDSALHMLQAQAEAGQSVPVATPEQARALLDATVKTARSMERGYREARQEAELLGPLDEMIYNHDRRLVEERTGIYPPPLDREQNLDEVTQELFRPRGPQPTAAEKHTALFAGVDRVIADRKLGPRDDLELPRPIAEKLAEQRKARLRKRF